MILILQISIQGHGPKPLPERADNGPFATHSDDLKAGLHVRAFL